MSLIHQALREIDAPSAASTAAVMPRPPRRAQRRNTVAWGVGLALAAAGAGLAGWHAGPRLKAALSPSAASPSLMAQAVAAPVPAAPAPAIVAAPAAVPAPVTAVSAVPAPAPAVVAVPDVPARSAAPAATAAVAAPAPVRRAAPQPAPVAVNTPAPVTADVLVADAAVDVPPRAAPRASARQAATPAQPAVRTAPPAAAMPVEQRFNLFLQGMRANDLVAAEQHLAALRRELPAGSLSLLRAEGWFALARGDADAAAATYQNILNRLPGDEEASINLASIEARRQRTEAARQVLAEAVRLHPESESLKAALARFRSAP
ncbi:tetratricopeptide repeat protein [Acidovorax sp. FG27]|uniref:tetratricopeptide repeat protein n=1 Tax=Acidovorax sp. FG27 TaxID=3133652 RepID=UPI0030E9883C